jgi:ABC-type transporter Mla maintaining outer membrane lipid asymmetry ATPase subunit MlaF
MAMEAVPEIELRGIRSVNGGYEALREVSLTLAKGETLFAMGVAGSGKSVLLKTAAGIAFPAEGEVLFRGKSLAKMSEREEAAFRKASGFVFQDAALWANQSLYDNLALPVRLHEPRWSKAEVEKAVLRAVDLVRYDQDLRARPAELSTGERKLVGLARALVLDPELLFMDDPTAGLDESSAALVPEIVASLKARGRSILVASASSDFASRCADSVAVIIGKTVFASGSYAEAAAWTDPRVRSVTGRLKAREPQAPAWAAGLAGAWVSALSEDDGRHPIPEQATGAEAAGGAPSGAPDAAPDGAPEDGATTVLGDLINDVGEEKDET